MNDVDSSGWLEYFADAPNASFFARAIEETDRLVVPSLSLFEVTRRILQQRDEPSALADSVILAPARRHSATLWTQDDAFEKLLAVKYCKKR